MRSQLSFSINASIKRKAVASSSEVWPVSPTNHRVMFGLLYLRHLSVFHLPEALIVQAQSPHMRKFTEVATQNK